MLLVLAGCGGGGGGSQAASSSAGDPTTAPATGDLGACAGQVQDEGRACYTSEIKVIVDRAGDRPLPAIQQVSEASYAEKSGFLLANCRGIMHTVGREWAIAHHLTLERLMDYVPRSNDPGCSAGLAHGLVGVFSDGKFKRTGCPKRSTPAARRSCIAGVNGMGDGPLITFS